MQVGERYVYHVFYINKLPKSSLLPLRGLDDIRGFLRYRIHRTRYMSTNSHREDTRIHNPQSLDPLHPQFMVHHTTQSPRHHPTTAHRMLPATRRKPPNRRRNLRVTTHIRPRIRLHRANLLHRPARHPGAHSFQTLHRNIQVGGVREGTEVVDGRVTRIRTINLNTPTTERPDHRNRDGVPALPRPLLPRRSAGTRVGKGGGSVGRCSR